MRLEIGTGQVIDNPSDDQILRALSSLDADKDGFAILGPDEMTYIQASGDARRGFHLEYQLGDVGRHYRADRTSIPVDEVVRAFVDYRNGTFDPATLGNWTRITF